MRKHFLPCLLFALGATFASLATFAQNTSWVDRRPSPDVAEKSWQEQAIALPPPPLDENLLALPGRDLDSNYTYLLDTASLSVGEEDGVVRYTIVLEPASGPRHVVHEGMRCWPEANRVYAIAGRGGFKPRAEEPWRAIPRRGPFAY